MSTSCYSADHSNIIDGSAPGFNPDFAGYANGGQRYRITRTLSDLDQHRRHSFLGDTYQKWPRKPSDFNQADWLARHTALLNEQRDQWNHSGYDVRVENQNAFRLRGQSAILAGKPDLLVLNNDRILIVDVKGGQEQPWHHYQVMIYMYALPKAMPEYRDAKFAGEIVYGDHTHRVPQGGIDQGFIRNLGSLIRRIAAPEPPIRVPSASECSFCDITAVDCPERVDERPEPEVGTTTDF